MGHVNDQLRSSRLLWCHDLRKQRPASLAPLGPSLVCNYKFYLWDITPAFMPSSKQQHPPNENKQNNQTYVRGPIWKWPVLFLKSWIQHLSWQAAAKSTIASQYLVLESSCLDIKSSVCLEQMLECFHSLSTFMIETITPTLMANIES